MTYAVPGPIRTNIVSSTSVGGIDSPFTRTRAVLDMMKGCLLYTSPSPRD